MKKLIIFFIVGLIFSIGYFWASPYMTIYKLKTGIMEQDPEKLSESIDFPLLRQNLKEQFNAYMMKSTLTELKDNLFGALGVALASKLIDGLVDSFVTPASLAILMEGKKPGRESGTISERQVEKKDVELFRNARYSFDSINKFFIWVPNEEGEEIRFVLTRTGMSWKLTNIIVPINKFEGQKDKIKLVKEPQPIEKPKRDSIVEKVKKERDKEKSDRLQATLEEIRGKTALDEIQKQMAKREVPSTPPPAPSPVTLPATPPVLSPSLRESKLNEYYGLIWAKIKQSWTIPENILKENVDLEAIIIIIIERDGRIQKSWFEKKSGNALYDQIAMRAVIKADPLPPIPKEFGKDSLEIGIRFFPN